MSRSAWVQAGARVIIKRAVRQGLTNRGLEAAFWNIPFDLVLDLARTTYVNEFVQEVVRWRAVAENMMHSNMPDRLSDAKLMIKQADLAEEVVRDLEATL